MNEKMKFEQLHTLGFVMRKRIAFLVVFYVYIKAKFYFEFYNNKKTKSNGRLIKSHNQAKMSLHPSSYDQITAKGLNAGVVKMFWLSCTVV